MEEETSLDANVNGDDGHHGLGDDIEDYMNDTSHVDDVAGLISPPNEGAGVPIEDTIPLLNDDPSNDDEQKDAAAKKIQDIANKKKERDDAKKVVNDLKAKKAEETEKKNDAANRIQDLATKKLERIEAQKVTNELRTQRDLKQTETTTDATLDTVTEETVETTSKPTSSKFVESKRQTVEDTKLNTTSTSEKDTFTLDDDDEAFKNFKPADLKIKLQDSFKNPPDPIRKKASSSGSVDGSPLGSKGNSSRSVNTDSSGGGSARNLEKKSAGLRFEKKIRRGSIKNHNSLMAPEVDHDDHDGEFTFDLKSEFGVSDAHIEEAASIASPKAFSPRVLSPKTLSPKPPDLPLDSESVPSVRKKSIRVIEPIATAAAAVEAVETVSPKSQKLSQKIKRKPTEEDEQGGEGAAATETTSDEKGPSALLEGEDVTSAVTMSSKMKPIRRKSRRAVDSASTDDAEGNGGVAATESNSSKENKPITGESLAAEGTNDKPPKMKISKSARVRSVGSTPNVASDVSPLLDGHEGNTSSKNRLMSVDDIASPSSSVIIASSKDVLPPVKRQHKPKIKLPELVPHEKKAGVAAAAAHVESSSDRKRRSVVEHDEYDEATGALKKKKPLYLRIIARANRKKQEEERQRNEAYNEYRQSRPKNTPSRQEIKEHMAKYDEIMRSKQDVTKETLAAKIKPFKRSNNAPNSRFLPPLFSPSKANIDGMDGIAADGIERLLSEDAEIGGGGGGGGGSGQKSKYNSPSNKMKQRLQVEDEMDLLANDERRERIKKQRELSDKVREDLHHKIQHKTPEKLQSLFAGEEGGAGGGHVGVSPSKKNIHRSPSKSDHHGAAHLHGVPEPDLHLPETENDESMLVSKLSPRSRSKHHKALASEHNRMHHDSHQERHHHPSSNQQQSHLPQRSRKQNSSSALKDMDGNLVFPNGVTEVSTYSQDYFHSSEVPAQLDPAVLITYCASDWIDRLKDNTSTVLVDDELSRMLSDV